MDACKSVTARFILVLGIALFCYGCSPNAKFIKPPYDVTDQPSATLIIMRRPQFAGSAYTMPVIIDKKLVAYIASGDYVEISVPPGERYIVVGDDKGDLLTNNERFIRINAIPDNTYYLRYLVETFSSSDIFQFELLSRDDGEKELKENKYHKLTITP